MGTEGTLKRISGKRPFNSNNQQGGGLILVTQSLPAASVLP